MNKIVPVLVTIFTLWVLLLIPFRIIGYGFMPPDDAMRHAAKAVSGKPWSEILVLRGDYKLDSHIGWHTILEGIHRLTKWDAHSLVLFSVVSLFLLFSFTAVILLKRPEAWAVTFLVMAVAYPSIIFRLLLGRPYIVTMAVIFALAALWQKLREDETPYLLVIALGTLIAASTWIHCGWYLFILPIISFCLAREWRAGGLMGLSTLLGVTIGSLLTGHPYLFFKQTIQHALLAFGNSPSQRVLVTEFQPSTGDFVIIIIVSFLLMWRHLRGRWSVKVVDNPVFILAGMCWISSFLTKRIWLDMGFAALLLWIARELEDAIEAIDFHSWGRLLLTIISLGALYFAVTNDVYGRWSEAHPKSYLSLENKEQSSWLPEPGGIIYSDSMDIFYQTFFKNPKAPWRYVLGFEPAIMPEEDLAIYRNIQLNYRAFSSFEPWVKKMHPQDRLIVHHRPGDAPKINGLEWNEVMDQTWIGRLPRKTH